MVLNRNSISKVLFLFSLLVTTFIGNTEAFPISAIQVKVVKAATEAKQKVRLFIIGNSFSQNAARFLPQMTKERGKELIIGRAELGGCSLQRHWEIAAAYEANPGDPKGKQYGGKSLKMLLAEGNWDVITIQQNSMNSSDLTTYQPYARNLYEYVKKLQPQAEVILHQTWAYRSDSKSFGLLAGNTHAKTQKEMWEKSRFAYHAIAKDLSIRIFPVGDAFWRVSSNAKWGYKPDVKYDYKKPVYPALPDQTNSLNIGYTWKEKTLSFDSNHANTAGEYLGSLIWYAMLFNESPAKVKFVPEKVPADFAAYLQKVAKKEVSKSKNISKKYQLKA